MAGPRDYYDVLGVPRDADQKAIKNAFGKLALKYHPDRSREPDAEERFKEIAEAYAILSDPQKRADYDARGHIGIAGFTPEDLFGGLDLEDIFGGFGFDLGPGGLFERLFGRRARRPRRGRDVEVELKVPLQTIATGGEEAVRVAHPTVCAACSGTGAKAGTQPRPCEACGGSGRQVRKEHKGGVSFQQITTCPACAGRGHFIDQPCPDCHGTGRSLRAESLKVKIPVGAEDGMALRVPGHGLPASEPGLPPGDLFVIVRSAPDPRFERHGSDLWRAETLDLVDVVLGTEVEVSTLEGKAKVTVPPGTQPASVLRLKGKGLPRYGDGGRGDLLLQVEVRVPQRLSAKQRELYERLRALGTRTKGKRS